jgi:hypothetical protein
MRLQGIDLLGDPHGPELGGDVGTDASGERQSGQNRSQLQHHGLAHQDPDEVQGNGPVKV